MRDVVLPFVAIGALLVGASAHGAIVHFENPAGAGHFDWVPPAGEETAGPWLDVTVSAADQALSERLGTFEQNQLYGDLVRVFGSNTTNTFTESQVAVYRPPGDLAAARPLGGVVGPRWADRIGYVWDQGGNLRDWGGASLFVDGVPAYLGVRFDLGDGYRYGYIGVVRDGSSFDAFAWGYETEVGVGVIIPTPGAASLLGVCGLAAVRRRRRR